LAKFVPETVRLNDVLPAAVVDGLSPEIDGGPAAGVTPNLTVCVDPCPLPFVTETPTDRLATTAVAGTDAVNCVDETYVVVNN